ncbi:CmpA/NrtA family ABC transporter substrate-binding protein [uncultured Paracoccus sp.]|uniref:CmpA/NrtA family ABC transporter substrate-binding protein n=1 Tax=uncultured Paracoccus sp. TaxID=189685 RepID=UPI00263264A1|nr:CmpA/NrtA family ABC transporter substrate-binding protein [uncultured Paracoccus sp.]
MTPALEIGFMPLVDAAPLIIARDMGFAAQERLDLVLHRAGNWSMLRDLLDLGRVQAAHMLSPMPVARSLGLGGAGPAVETLMVLSMNGQVVGVSPDLARDMRAVLPGAGFGDAGTTRQALRAARPDGLRLGVPFPFSMHAELLDYWLGRQVTLATVPPPDMAAAIGAGDIEAFCVGEPWGSQAVELGEAELILPGAAIWSQAPEKVLAVRAGWAEENADLAGRLMRAVWRAGQWLSLPQNTDLASELLSAPDCLGVDPEIIDRALTGQLLTRRGGELIRSPALLEFHHGAANFPWRSQAAWIAGRMARRFGLDRRRAAHAAQAIWRSDLYRQHLADLAILPAASSKLEGACPMPQAVGATRASLILSENRFFDGLIFDPSADN